MAIQDSAEAGKEEEQKSLQPPPLRPALIPVEPSFMQEFREISSHYVPEDKVDSADISSNGEFDRADKMEVMAEDDPEVLRI